MDEEYLALLADLHKHQKRQGPGGEAETARALDLAGLKNGERLRVADIGCGTGASALQLARSLNAEITAVDCLPDFIDILKQRAADENLSGSINPIVGAMENLPFANDQFDVIWSEGAIYNMGFENGVRAWRQYLKQDGVLVVSEITWITGARPAELQTYWQGEYPEIATASSKIRVLEEGGYAPVAYFVLPEHCWIDNYYAPLHDQLPQFLARHEGNEMAEAVAQAEAKELELYNKYKRFYSYGVYVARKVS